MDWKQDGDVWYLPGIAPRAGIPAACAYADVTGQWWVIVAHATNDGGPFATLDEAKAAAERELTERAQEGQ